VGLGQYCEKYQSDRMHFCLTPFLKQPPSPSMAIFWKVTQQYSSFLEKPIPPQYS